MKSNRMIKRLKLIKMMKTHNLIEYSLRKREEELKLDITVK